LEIKITQIIQTRRIIKRNTTKTALSFKKSLIIKLLEKKFIDNIIFLKINLAKKIKNKTELINLILLIKSFLLVHTEHINKITTITPPKKTNTKK